MPEKDLQRLTSSVDYIDHSQSPRRPLPTRRHYITQKVTVQCHELLTSQQCHELFSRRLLYNGNRASAGPLLFAFSCLYCNDDSLYSPGEGVPAISSDIPQAANHLLASPSHHQRLQPHEKKRRTAGAMSSFNGGP